VNHDSMLMRLKVSRIPKDTEVLLPIFLVWILLFALMLVLSALSCCSPALWHLQERPRKMAIADLSMPFPSSF